jgi:hypothetical protein
MCLYTAVTNTIVFHDEIKEISKSLNDCRYILV